MPYLRALRRGIWVLVILLVVGALAGWFTGQDSPNSPSAKRFYRATTLLAYSGNQLGNSQGDGVASLDQVALYATTGEVPKVVAAKLGTSPQALAPQISTYTSPSTNTIAIVGVADSPSYAVTLSATTATALLDQLTNITSANKGDALRQLDDARRKVEERIAELQNTIDNDQDPAKVRDAKASMETAQAQLALYKSRIDELVYSGVALGLTKIQDPYAVRVSEAEFLGWKKFAQGGLAALPEANRGVNADGSRASGAPVFPPLTEPVPRTTRAILGGLLGILLGGVGLLVRFRLDNRIRSKHEAEDAFGVDVIAEIPPLSRSEQKYTSVASHVEPRGTFAEAYRSLRTSVEFVGGSDRSMRLSEIEQALGGDSGMNQNGSAEEAASSGAQVILITSAMPAEGKTVTVSNLAAVLAESGASVLVVNCDYRRPQIANYLIPAEGASRRTKATTDGRPVVRSSIVPGVKLVTGIGEQDVSANPTEVALLQRRVIELARPRFDYILLDTAPMLTTNDASEILPEADLVILVCRSGKTTRDSAERLSEVLRRYGAPVLGTVLTDSSEAPGARYSYYYYHEVGDTPQTPVQKPEAVSLEL